MKRGKRNHGTLPTATRSVRLPIELWARLAIEAGRTGESMNGLLWRVMDGLAATLCNHEFSTDPNQDPDICIHCNAERE